MSGRWPKWYLVLTLLLSSPHLYAQVSATLKPSQSQALVGDRILLSLEVAQPAGQTLTWPAVPDSLGPALFCVDRGRVDTAQVPGGYRYRQQLYVSGFDSGILVVPPIPVRDANGATLATTEPIPLLVQTVPVDTTKPYRPIKDIIPVEQSWLSRYWAWLAGAVLVLLAAVVLWLFLRRKKSVGPVPATPQKVETPAARAVRKLQELDEARLWQQGRVKAYYATLTEIIRTYLDEAFGLPAPELTSDELLAALRQKPQLRAQDSNLGQLLWLADGAKFARAEPLPADHEEALRIAQQLINNTAMPPAAEPQNPAAS